MKILEGSINKIRLIFQIIFTSISNGYLKGFAEGSIYRGSSKSLCLPGLNCYSCPGALGACPIGSMQAVLNSRNYSMSFYIVGFLISLGGIFGRLVCGWACPFGLYQDLLYKIKIFRKKKNLYFHNYLKNLKYLILLLFVIILPLALKGPQGISSPYYCKYICPSGSLMAGIPLVAKDSFLQESIGFLFSWKMGILLFITILSVKFYRPFCKYICPLGAIYGLFNSLAIYRFTIENSCIDCGRCKKVCKMDIETNRDPNSRECIRCGDCIEVCPVSAIKTPLNKKSAPEKNMKA